MKGKMKFKGFSFDVNPASVEVYHKRNISEKALLSGRSRVRDEAVCPTEIHGKGCFYGENAYESLSALETLHSKGGEGWLYLPQGSVYKVYFKELSFCFNADKNRYDYSFVFIECMNGKKPLYNFSFTIALNDENLFQIADRCNTPVEQLMALNDYKTPFAVSAGDRVVLK